MWFVLNVKCFKMVKYVLCPLWKCASLWTDWRGKTMGGISFLEGKWKGEKNNVILLWFSTGDFERIYLSFSGKTHIQIVELLNFRISREILSSHSQLPRLPRMFHPASRLSTKPASDDVYFFISFHSSPFYFWANLVFSRFFCLLTRKSVFLQPLPIGPSYTFLGFSGGSSVKNPPSNAGDLGSIPGSGRSPIEESGNPFQYSGLGNPMGQRSLAGNSPRGCRE